LADSYPASAEVSSRRVQNWRVPYRSNVGVRCGDKKKHCRGQEAGQKLRKKTHTYFIVTRDFSTRRVDKSEWGGRNAIPPSLTARPDVAIETLAPHYALGARAARSRSVAEIC